MESSSFSSSIHEFDELFNQLENLKENLSSFINYNYELINKNGLESINNNNNR